MYAKIGLRVRTLRKRKGFTQEKLAEKCGISISFLGHIERGTRKLSVETLYKLTEALNCSADELLGTGRMNVSSISLLLASAAKVLEEQGL